MVAPLFAGPENAVYRRWLTWSMIISSAIISLSCLRFLPVQPAAIDFWPMWAGGGAALDNPSRLYDFNYITDLQGWPLGPGAQRPFIYPPSALFLFSPLSRIPYWLGYAVWMTAGLALFGAGAKRIGAPLWCLLLPFVTWAVYCGQITLLIGGLVMLGLSLKARPVWAGVLFGVAASIKPQLLILLPVALIARRDWITFVVTGVTGLAICIASAAVFGLQLWFDWFGALAPFQQMIMASPAMLEDATTPFAALTLLGIDGRWAFLGAPLVLFAVWKSFRDNAAAPAQLTTLFGGVLMITPYAMNYEIALISPVLAYYLARRDDPAWGGHFVAAMAHQVLPPLPSILAILAMPLVQAISRRRPATLRVEVTS